MSRKKVALFLVEHSDFQELLKKDASDAAARSGLALEAHYTGHDFAAQLKQIGEAIDGKARPDAIVVLPVRDRGLLRTARTAIQAGISFIFLDRTEDDLGAIRADAQGWATVSEVCPDEIETGRIQGRQYRRLLPEGGRLLYVQGSTRSLTAKDRTQGMQEIIAGSKLEVTLVEAGWSEEEAHKATHHRVMLLGRMHMRIDLIGCHTDQIAVGVMKALEEAAKELQQPEIAATPVAGCDATLELGQRLVQTGRMAASVSLPRVAGPAVEAFAKQLQGTPIPPQVYFKGASFPAEDRLTPLPRRS